MQTHLENFLLRGPSVTVVYHLGRIFPGFFRLIRKSNHPTLLEKPYRRTCLYSTKLDINRFFFARRGIEHYTPYTDNFALKNQPLTCPPLALQSPSPPLRPLQTLWLNPIPCGALSHVARSVLPRPLGSLVRFTSQEQFVG